MIVITAHWRLNVKLSLLYLKGNIRVHVEQVELSLIFL